MKESDRSLEMKLQTLYQTASGVVDEATSPVICRAMRTRDLVHYDQRSNAEHESRRFGCAAPHMARAVAVYDRSTPGARDRKSRESLPGEVTLKMAAATINTMPTEMVAPGSTANLPPAISAAPPTPTKRGP